MRQGLSIALKVGILFAFHLPANGQDIRLKFAKSQTSKTVTGRVGTGGRICYFSKVKQGQKFKATLSSKSGKVAIFETGELTFEEVVEFAGDQSVCVDNLAGSTTYTLTVSIK